jgi:magnesium chelatase subunit I
MSNNKALTLGALKESGYKSISVKLEMRNNVISYLKNKQNLFDGIIGYDETVIPALINAVLSQHDILLLGLRGQAKTRILRSMVQFLDEWVPVLEGSPINEDPLKPILPASIKFIEDHGDDSPIFWKHRSERFHEKLATPDVSMADLIGDIDPIKASRDQLDLSDTNVINYGLIPKTNRGLFLINELPDLQGRIQVGLLNILEESDVQIRNFPVKLNLDLAMLFTANPEDYTNRGNIITPLKDRIASQILTHYPKSRELSATITAQEAQCERSEKIIIPDLYKNLIEEIAIQARKSEHIDQTSGVSARLTLSAMELLHSNIERRSIIKNCDAIVRMPDLLAVIPAICGKIELVYEGEQEGPHIIAEKIIGKAVKKLFEENFPSVLKSKKGEESDPFYSRIQQWFSLGQSLALTDYEDNDTELKNLIKVDGLKELLDENIKDLSKYEQLPWLSFIVEALHQNALLSREGKEGAWCYSDMLMNMMDDMK